MNTKFYNYKKYIISSLIILFFTFLFPLFVNAETIENENNVEQTKIVDETENKKIENIEECLDILRKKINFMFQKIEALKDKEAYENYPAVRLNIDTPLFGISSVIENKLKIIRNVSAIDVATGYSIKDVIRKEIIKVPSFSIGNLTVLTREVKLDSNITDSDYNTVLLNLVYYIKQVEDADKFLDKQIQHIFSGYVKKEIEDTLKSYSIRIKEIYEKLDVLDEKLVEIYIQCNNVNEYSQLLKKYNELYDSNYKIEENTVNVLIEEEKLNICKEDLEALEKEVEQFSLKIDEIIYENKKNIDFGNILLNLKKDVTDKRNKIKDYIDNSIVTNTLEESESNVVETVKLYDVVSTEILDFFDEKIIDINKKIAIYAPSLSQNTDIPEEVINKTEVINVGEMSQNDKEKLYKDILEIYNICNEKENKFYLDNINYYLSDSTKKISEIVKVSNISLNLEDLSYFYLELPDVLNGYMLKNSLKNSIRISELTLKFENEILKIRDTHTNLKKIFNQIEENQLEDRSSI